MSDGPSLLVVQHLNAGYGHSQVLFNLSLLAPSRGAVAILGRNGAGKSTLLKTIAGEISPMSGIIWFDQRHTVEEASERRVRRGLGYVPQENAIFGRMGGERKMLAIGRALVGRPKLLMLDEPTEGVWVGVIDEIAEQLAKLASSISLILVEQHVELALRLAQYAYVHGSRFDRA